MTDIFGEIEMRKLLVSRNDIQASTNPPQHRIIYLYAIKQLLKRTLEWIKKENVEYRAESG